MNGPRGKHLIPLYNATEPIVCTITDGERPLRGALFERIRAASTSVDRSRDGMIFQFLDLPEVRTVLDELTVVEKRCCQFWGFDVSTAPGGGLVLRWDGPPDVAPILDRLFAFFTGDEPVQSLAGLL